MKNHLVLGVTGGIASGKTTVSAILEELGAPLIDFDVLARQVVEPGKPALKLIVDYFGKVILQADGALDRKKLAGIVFSDSEKRQKLESFTHTAIFKEYLNQVSVIAAGKPDAVIQVAVPLLFELNLQSSFDKVLVVYVSPGRQVERLVARDGVSRDAAARILKSQLPIDEKVAPADYVINNEGSMEKTRRQVEALWEKLQNV